MQHVEIDPSQRRSLPIYCFGTTSTDKYSLQFQSAQGDAVDGADVHWDDDLIDGGESEDDDSLHSESAQSDDAGVNIPCIDEEGDGAVGGMDERRDSPLPFCGAQSDDVDDCTLDDSDFVEDQC